MSKKLSLAGKTFARLTWYADAPSVGGRTRSRWRCVCGNEIVAFNKDVHSGNSKSCGCLQRERAREYHLTHGQSETLIFKRWTGMIHRCKTPSATGFKYYGARGIKVCERWTHFENFLADMGVPEPGFELDRIDKNGNYEPSNCRWVTRKEQMRNTRQNRVLTVFGVTACVAELCEIFGIPYRRALKRLKLGWPVEKCFH